MAGAPRAFTLLHKARRSSELTSLSSRFLNAGRMSRSTMLLRIARVLSAILASASHRNVMSPKFLAAVSRRFSRCFSCAGDLPWATALLASRSFSRAKASEMPAGP